MEGQVNLWHVLGSTALHFFKVGGRAWEVLQPDGELLFAKLLLVKFGEPFPFGVVGYSADLGVKIVDLLLLLPP